jgi:hypothetical protein
MINIEYDVDLNESGRPCIKLSPDYEDKPEDKFLAVELTRYLIQNVFNNKSDEYDKEAADRINICVTVLHQIGDEMAILLYEQMKVLGETSFMLNNNYHFSVQSIDDRDKINTKNIVDNGKIYDRKEGLKVLVLDEMKVYELIGGIENENWKEK